MGRRTKYTKIRGEGTKKKKKRHSRRKRPSTKLILKVGRLRKGKRRHVPGRRKERSLKHLIEKWGRSAKDPPNKGRIKTTKKGGGGGGEPKASTNPHEKGQVTFINNKILETSPTEEVKKNRNFRRRQKTSHVKNEGPSGRNGQEKAATAKKAGEYCTKRREKSVGRRETITKG